MGGDVFVANDKNLGVRAQFGNPRSERGDDAAPDHDVIAARAE